MQDTKPNEERGVAGRGIRTRSRASIGAMRNPETHRAILDAAAAVLEESGYAGFSMDAVARRANSSKPTIYRWWRNKAALIMEVYEEASEAALAATDTGSLRGELILRLTTLWTWWEETWGGEGLRSIVAEAQLDPVTLDELRSRFVPRRIEFIRLVFDRAVARGELADASGVEVAVAHLIGTSWLYLLTGRLQEREVIAPHVDAVVKGLATGSSTADLPDR
ncbi:TetR/AcrR family transcriptional regulator [Phenylobacterium sp.]|uniref:TetR/AcrR family transcriptional regulator n=1 Tax=Phenylobacterium sp. TaxID=1871053 RepID=UPI00273422C8|nr:TetR/AcrR family transcriptional regulator [Phenylobacterium sp.]MDP3855841.1 TetR/AcrR family transcriptional regulator [Phenylobacterium sp.]